MREVKGLGLRVSSFNDRTNYSSNITNKQQTYYTNKLMK